MLKNEDFDNDAKDAGDIGAGHTVTALYEIVPAGTEAPKYAAKGVSAENNSDELLTLKIRYKKPDGDVSTKQEFLLKEQNIAFEKTSESFRFSSAVALFGMLLRGSENAKEGTFANVIEVASKAKSFDPGEHKNEFIDLVKKIEAMKTVPVNASLED
jgi:Ca-activated chloride channel family protein